MKRRLVVVVSLLVLAAVAVAGALVAANPRVRARYHLNRVSAGELARDGFRVTFVGHSLAFIQSPAAPELLPELYELARAEGQRDDDTCYRVLFLGALSDEPWPRDGEYRLVRPKGELSDSVLAVLASCLRSHDELLATRALTLLPPEPRLLEAVLRYARREPKPQGVRLWLLRFLGERPAVVRQEGPAAQAEPDEAWRLEQLDSIGEIVAGLEKWLERHRAKLPEQIK